MSADVAPAEQAPSRIEVTSADGTTLGLRRPCGWGTIVA